LKRIQAPTPVNKSPRGGSASSTTWSPGGACAAGVEPSDPSCGVGPIRSVMQPRRSPGNGLEAEREPDPAAARRGIGRLARRRRGRRNSPRPNYSVWEELLQGAEESAPAGQGLLGYLFAWRCSRSSRRAFGSVFRRRTDSFSNATAAKPSGTIFCSSIVGRAARISHSASRGRFK
jgi:hypothetical protein